MKYEQTGNMYTQTKIKMQRKEHTNIVQQTERNINRQKTNRNRQKHAEINRKKSPKPTSIDRQKKEQTEADKNRLKQTKWNR